MGHRIFTGRDEHKFSAAHMTVFPDGTKERLHGHNYQVSVSLELTRVSAETFLDLGIVKRAMREICRSWNERVLLAAECARLSIERHDEAEIEFKLCGKRYVLPADEVVLLPVDNVILENLTRHFAELLTSAMGADLARARVASLDVEVQELRGQGASYRHAL